MKKVLGIVLTLTIAFAMAACGAKRGQCTRCISQ